MYTAFYTTLEDGYKFPRSFWIIQLNSTADISDYIRGIFVKADENSSDEKSFHDLRCSSIHSHQK